MCDCDFAVGALFNVNFLPEHSGIGSGQCADSGQVAASTSAPPARPFRLEHARHSGGAPDDSDESHGTLAARMSRPRILPSTDPSRGMRLILAGCFSCLVLMWAGPMGCAGRQKPPVSPSPGEAAPSASGTAVPDSTVVGLATASADTGPPKPNRDAKEVDTPAVPRIGPPGAVGPPDSTTSVPSAAGLGSADQSPPDPSAPALVLEYADSSWHSVARRTARAKQAGIRDRVLELLGEMSASRGPSHTLLQVQAVAQQGSVEQDSLHRAHWGVLHQAELALLKALGEVRGKSELQESAATHLRGAREQAAAERREMATARAQLTELDLRERQLDSHLSARLAGLAFSQVGAGRLQQIPGFPPAGHGAAIDHAIAREATQVVYKESLPDLPNTLGAALQDRIVPPEEARVDVIDNYHLDVLRFLEGRPHFFRLQRVAVYPFQAEPSFSASTGIVGAPAPGSSSQVDARVGPRPPSNFGLSDQEHDFWIQRAELDSQALEHFHRAFERLLAEYSNDLALLNIDKDQTKDRIRDSETRLAERESAVQTQESKLQLARDEVRDARQAVESTSAEYEVHIQEAQRFCLYTTLHTLAQAHEHQLVDKMVEEAYEAFAKHGLGADLASPPIRAVGTSAGHLLDPGPSETTSGWVLDRFRVLGLARTDGAPTQYAMSLAGVLMPNTAGCLDQARVPEGFLITRTSEHAIQWRWITTDVTSPYRAHGQQEAEWGPQRWRLPNLSELEMLHQCIQSDEAGDAVLAHLGWPTDEPYIASGRTAGKYVTYHLGKSERVLVDIGDNVYSLRIQDLPDHE